MRFAGVVPAAGASRRMGEPKGLLRIDGVPFVRRVVEALAGAACAPVLVVVAEGDTAVAAEAAAAGATVVRNPDPGDGPITSLRLALDALDDDVDGIVYLPLDHALVTSETVATLLREARRSDAPLTLPVHGDKRGHPAVFRRRLFAELRDPELQGGARTVVHRHLQESCLVPFDDPSVTMDIDTPEVYAAAVQAHRSGADA
jgi:molybdenum cofactor cytidylyltransferase